MHVVYAHECPPESAKGERGIFLAGPSPRSAEDINWRPGAVDTLKEIGFTGIVYVPLPRDGNWSPEYDAQVSWELKYLEGATCIAFWIPRDLNYLPGFTTNVEFGLYVRSGKIILGYPVGAPKMKYLDLLAKKFKVPIKHTLRDTLIKAVQMADRG